MQRGSAATVSEVGVCTVSKEHPHNFLVAVMDCLVQGGHFAFPSNVRVNGSDWTDKKHLHQLDIPVLHG